MRLPASLALGHSTLDVRPGIWLEASLGQGDAVDHGVESPVAATVEAMARQAGGRCFERRRSCGVSAT